MTTDEFNQEQSHQAQSNHPISSSSEICIPHRSNKRKFIGQDPSTLILADYNLIWLSPHHLLNQLNPSENKLGSNSQPIQNQTTSIKSNSIFTFPPSTRLDILNTPLTKPIKTITTIPTRRSSILSICSLRLNTPVNHNLIKTWSGSHFEIGADLEEVLKQASLSATQSQFNSTRTHQSTRTSVSETAFKSKKLSISTGLLPTPNPIEPTSSGPFISGDIPNSSDQSHSYPPSQPSSPLNNEVSSSSGDSSGPVPLSDLLPPEPNPITEESDPQFNQHIFISPDAKSTKPVVQLATDHMGPVEYERPLPRKSNFESVLEAQMLVKLQWSDKNPHRLSLEPTSRISVAEEPFKPFKVVLNERSLELYEYSKGFFKNRTYSWKLVHSILLIPTDTHFSRPFASELAFCLTVNFNHHSLQTHHQPHLKERFSFFSSSIGSKLSHITHHHHQAQPKPSRARLLHQKSPHQLANFIFIPSSKSLGDIISFELWQRLGGKLPRQVLVDTIGLSSYVQVPITRSLKGKPIHLSDHELREATIKCLNENEDYAEMYSRFQSKGRDVQLAWRRQGRLDWISPLPHSIITGNLPLKQLQISNAMRGFSVQSTKEPPVLELRPALHYPNSVTLSDGSLREEPSGLEGFVTYFKPGSKTGKRVYLSTFDGMLFICRSSLAILPKAPVSDDQRERLMNTIQTHSSQSDSWPRNLRSTHVCSSHPISPSIANPSSPITQSQPSTSKKKNSNPNLVEEITTTLSTTTHPSNEPHLNPKQFETLLSRFYSDELNRQKELVKRSYKLIDMKEIKSIERSESMKTEARRYLKPKKMKRKTEVESLTGFRLELNEGHRIELMTSNEIETDQWIQHLTELSTYWQARVREDVKIEMLALNGTLKPVWRDGDEVRRFDHDQLRISCSEELQTSLLSSLYHWCIVEGCRTITRSGKLHKKSYKGNTWDTREIVISGGNLIEYSKESIEINHFNNRKQTHLHRKRHQFELRLSFVCTGEALRDQIPKGEIIPGFYSDGLHTRDGLSECVLILWIDPLDSQIRKATTAAAADHDDDDEKKKKKSEVKRSEEKIGIRKIRVYKARNGLERDLWIDSIRFEIERSMRMKEEGRMK
ncbi:Pleckstrin homology domain-containing protein [Melampsora americana]|nr:Pleckstrin homology domain-containing protein [Melampsora americana]